LKDTLNNSIKAYAASIFGRDHHWALQGKYLPFCFDKDITNMRHLKD
jgi:hypothetical protein